MAETIISRLLEASRIHADRIALSFRPGFRFERWTYRQLWSDVGAMSAMLRSAGLQPGDRVLIWAPSCPQWAVAFFGTLKAGGIVVPMDLRVSGSFVQTVIEKTEPRFAIVSQVTPDHPALKDVERLYFEDFSELLETARADADDADNSQELAEILFTSGTTGNPKGVMLTHENLIAAVDSALHQMPVNPEDRMLSVLPLSHVYEQAGGLLLPMWNGAGVTYATSREPQRLSRLMRDTSPTTMLVVPQVLDLLMKSIEREVSRQGKERVWQVLNGIAGNLPIPVRRLIFRSVHKRFGGSLVRFVCGGAAISVPVAEAWERLGVMVVQGYGATEASPTISSSTYSDRRFDSVGKPPPGIDIRIAEGGEIQVRGRNITPGYWQDEQATADTFDGEWLKTGDMGEFDDDGYLYLRGRKRHMIVLANGMNVFPEDVEATILGTGLVSQCAVVGFTPNESVTVHAVFPASEGESASEAVRLANTTLGDHQRVADYSLWPGDALPMTHTLKVKKAEILDWLDSKDAPSQPDAADGAADAKSPTLYKILASIVTSLSEDVSPDFRLGSDLGLDSLGRIELIVAVEEQLGVSLDESELQDETTIGQVQGMIDAGPDTGPRIQPSFAAWGRRFWARGIRGVLQPALMSTSMRIGFARRVTGTEHLAGLEHPVVFVANHNMRSDVGLMLRSFPWRTRRRLAVAAAADLWRNRLRALVNPLFGNAFPIERQGPALPSLENLGRVLDEGWSILIFPEGDLYPGTEIQPFKTGIGMIAVEGGVPIVPMRLTEGKKGWPAGFHVVRRSKVEVAFGQPIRFRRGDSYRDVTMEIEDAVRKL